MLEEYAVNAVVEDEKKRRNVNSVEAHHPNDWK